MEAMAFTAARVGAFTAARMGAMAFAAVRTEAMAAAQGPWLLSDQKSWCLSGRTGTHTGTCMCPRRASSLHPPPGVCRAYPVRLVLL